MILIMKMPKSISGLLIDSLTKEESRVKSSYRVSKVKAEQQHSY